MVPALADSFFASLALCGLGVATVVEGLATATPAAHRSTGVPGQVVPDAGRFPIAIAVLAIGHVIEGQVFHVAAAFEQSAPGVFDGPPPRAKVADDLNCSEHQAVALLQPAGSASHCSREFGAHGAGPDEVEVSGLKGSIVPLEDVAAQAWLTLRVRVETRNLPSKGLEGSADALRAGEQLQQSHVFPRATTKATWPR